MPEKCVLALGTFDGLHPGHRAVLKECIRLAGELSVKSAVYTFIENPKSLFGTSPMPLMSCEEKCAGMRELGIDEIHAVHFTPELARLSPEEFVAQLSDSYNPAGLVAGADYTFGAHKSGTAAVLEELGRARGIAVSIIPLVTSDNTKISSTRIRAALEAGDTAAAAMLMKGEV